MLIIPAIDILNEKVVRLEKGDFTKEKIYSDSPARIARRWEAVGAKYLHIVDLDGARAGIPVNLDSIYKIVQSVKIPVQLGGGLRTLESIEEAFDLGVSRVVLGTKAIEDPNFAKTCITMYRDKVIFSVDVKEGKVATKGWEEQLSLSPLGLAKRFEVFGADGIIYTDISRDGMMSGPNLEILKSFLSSTTMNIVISGGVSSIDDIKALKKLPYKNLEGVIIGKALYEGKIDLREALRC